MSNRNTARIEKVKRAELAPRRDAGQAGALDRPAPSNHNRGPTPRNQLFAVPERRPQDEREDFTLPPLPGKIHPPMEKDDATPTLDDEVRNYHHHPSEGGTTEFAFDPDAADAAADLAGDLGCHFLEGVTQAEDLSSRVLTDEDREEGELPFVIEDADAFELVDLDPWVPGLPLDQQLDQQEEEEGGEAAEEAPREGHGSKRSRTR